MWLHDVIKLYFFAMDYSVGSQRYKRTHIGLYSIHNYYRIETYSPHRITSCHVMNTQKQNTRTLSSIENNVAYMLICDYWCTPASYSPFPVSTNMWFCFGKTQSSISMYWTGKRLVQISCERLRTLSVHIFGYHHS